MSSSRATGSDELNPAASTALINQISRQLADQKARAAALQSDKDVLETLFQESQSQNKIAGEESSKWKEYAKRLEAKLERLMGAAWNDDLDMPSSPHLPSSLQRPASSSRRQSWFTPAKAAAATDPAGGRGGDPVQENGRENAALVGVDLQAQIQTQIVEAVKTSLAEQASVNAEALQSYWLQHNADQEERDEMGQKRRTLHESNVTETVAVLQTSFSSQQGRGQLAEARIRALLEEAQGSATAWTNRHQALTDASQSMPPGTSIAI